MLRQELTYKKITAALEKNPNESVTHIAERLKLNPGMYYKHRKLLGLGKQKAAVKYQRIKTKESKGSITDNQKMIFVMGTADQIREFVGGVL